MADLDLSHAAFAGFRLTWRKPMMILVWGLGLFIFSLIASAMLAVHGGAQLAAIEQPAVASSSSTAPSTAQPRKRIPLFGAAPQAPAATPAPPPDPQAQQAEMALLRQQIHAFMIAAAPAFAVIAPLGLILGALFKTAVWRGVLAPGQGGLGFLRLGPAELRQLAVQLLIAAFFLLAEIVVGIALGLTAGLVATASAIGGALLFLVLTVLAAGAGVVALVRLSLAGPATFLRRKVQVLSALPTSRSLFWPILGAYLLALILGLLVALLGQAISLGILAAVGGLGGVMHESSIPTSLAEVVSPLRLAETLLASVFGAMQLIVLTAPAADLYRQITGEGETEPT